MGIVIPAIDIQNGKCVRLTKGLLEQKTVYHENPLDALSYWIEQGAERLHIVDLDGAFGIGTNFSLIKKMISYSDIKLQVGGGIRSLDTAENLIDLGVDRVVIGTSAVKNPDFISELSERIGSDSIIVALDQKDGKIAIKGWTETIETDLLEFGKLIEKKGAGFVLVSSVEKDGTFLGPDIETTKKMIKSIDIPVIAAGGIRNISDILELKKIGVNEIIVGKAFYENRIKFFEVKNLY